MLLRVSVCFASCASRVGMSINAHFDGLSLLDVSGPNAIKPQKLWNRNHCFRLLRFHEKFQIGTFLQSIYQNYLKVRIRKCKCDIINYLVQLYQTHLTIASQPENRGFRQYLMKVDFLWDKQDELNRKVTALIFNSEN